MSTKPLTPNERIGVLARLRTLTERATEQLDEAIEHLVDGAVELRELDQSAVDVATSLGLDNILAAANVAMAHVLELVDSDSMLEQQYQGLRDIFGKGPTP